MSEPHTFNVVSFQLQANTVANMQLCGKQIGIAL